MLDPNATPPNRMKPTDPGCSTATMHWKREPAGFTRSPIAWPTAAAPPHVVEDETAFHTAAPDSNHGLAVDRYQLAWVPGGRQEEGAGGGRSGPMRSSSWDGKPVRRQFQRRAFHGLGGSRVRVQQQPGLPHEAVAPTRRVEGIGPREVERAPARTHRLQRRKGWSCVTHESAGRQMITQRHAHGHLRAESPLS